MRVSPLGALVAIVILGVTIEAVEQQSKQAAYILVVILLLGMITFNAAVFNRQLTALIAAINARVTPQQAKANAVATPVPFGKR